ncbi:hypothetical protein DXG01_001910, partial [Tephrocybe rancida]
MLKGSRASAQVWKVFLLKRLQKPMENHTIRLPKKSRGSRLKQEASEWFDNAGLELKGMPMEVMFNGASYSVTELLPPAVVTQILWECFEANFHLELTRLDSHLMPNDWEDDKLRLTREILIRDVFFDPLLMPEGSPGETTGGDFIIMKP